MRILYNVSFVDRDGYRKLLGPNQGRCMKETREEAEGQLAALLRESADRLVDVCGPRSRGTFRVDAFRCYDHGDPMGIYVEEDEDGDS